MLTELRRLIFSIALLTWSGALWGQVIEVPLKHRSGSEAFRTQKIQLIDTLSLPFWDDFSSSQLIPDSSKWLVGADVNINRGRGLNPPSINVATFDGTNQYGVPYSDMDLRGEADSLVSQPIDLSTIPIGLKSTLYFSFFWQKKGNGEIPEKEDSLRLQFKDLNGIWATVWNAVGGDTLYIDTFKQEIIQIPPGQFQHGGVSISFPVVREANGRV